MGNIINRRRVSGSKKLPYDAEIEYLQSSGTQYINTRVTPTLDTEIQCVVVPLSNNVSVINTDLQNTFGIHITCWTSGSWACYFGDKGYIPVNNKFPFKYNTPQSIILNYQKVIIDGVEQDINATSMSGTTMYMFKSTWTQNIDNTRICSLKIKQNNILVRDFIPVRVGNVGYMYDKITGQLFGNAGTGDFILGSDLYVDMGLPSGTLWATRNIDVTKPCEFAASPFQYECSFFSWGNVDGHNPISNSAFDYNWG